MTHGYDTSVTWLFHVRMVTASRSSQMDESCHICLIYMGHVCDMTHLYEGGDCIQEFSNGWVMSHMSHIHGSCLWHDSFIWLIYMKVVAACRNSKVDKSCHICFIYMGHVNLWPAGVFVCGKRRRNMWQCAGGGTIYVYKGAWVLEYSHMIRRNATWLIFMLMSNINKSHVANTYSQMQIGWHSILRLFLKTFNLVPDVPGFSWDSSLITWY